jgi:hypothetical protein
LNGEFKDHDGPLRSSNPFSSATFWDATPIVRAGAKNPVKHEQLWQLPDNLKVRENWKVFKKHWDTEMADPEYVLKSTFPQTLFRLSFQILISPSFEMSR